MACSLEPASREQWQTAAPLYADYNYRHLWDYGLAVARRRGAECEHVVATTDGAVIGLADVRIKRTPMVGGGIAYISGGPLTRRQRDDDLKRLRDVAGLLVYEYVERRGLILRVLPPLGSQSWNAAAAKIFEDLGFQTTSNIARYRTMVVPLDRYLSDIRKGLAQKWRNCLNASERAQLTVKQESGRALLDQFCSLFREFNRRKGFAVDLDEQFYRALQSQLGESEKLTVAMAYDGGRAIAGHVGSVLGDTSVYLLGATSEQGLTKKAAYLLQWNAICYAHSRGMQIYDLGGIDPTGNPGVYHFKAGLCGADVASPGPFEISRASVQTRLTFAAERLYRRLRRPRAMRATTVATAQATISSGR